MASTGVAQAGMLARELERVVRTHRPASLAILGCAGGNGFEAIDPSVTSRVVAIDVNPAYLRATRERFAERLPGLELREMDLQAAEVTFTPVQHVFAALILEYVALEPAFANIRKMCRAHGRLTTLVQLASTTHAPVTLSAFTSLQTLRDVMQLRTPEEVENAARAAGFRQDSLREIGSPGGKCFAVQEFETQWQR